jgi:creatinine amidohydrolase
MLMALRPELVDTSRLEEARCVEPGRVAGQAQALHSAMKFEERTPSGAIGDPTAASAEKGEKLLEAAATAVAGVLSDDDLWKLRA